MIRRSPSKGICYSTGAIQKIQSLEDGLSSIGLSPSNIDTVILIHLHWDHVELARQFTKARFVVQKTELGFAYDPHPLDAARYIKELFDGLNFQPVDGDTQIEEGMKVLLTPGHTTGGQSVAIETTGGLAVITGFCCISDNFEPPADLRETMPLITPGIHLNAVQAHDGMRQVKEMADIVIPLHDPASAAKRTIP